MFLQCLCGFLLFRNLCLLNTCGETITFHSKIFNLFCHVRYLFSQRLNLFETLRRDNHKLTFLLNRFIDLTLLRIVTRPLDVAQLLVVRFEVDIPHLERDLPLPLLLPPRPHPSLLPPRLQSLRLFRCCYGS